jgi:hypothetical protein
VRVVDGDPRWSLAYRAARGPYAELKLGLAEQHPERSPCLHSRRPPSHGRGGHDRVGQRAAAYHLQRRGRRDACATPSRRRRRRQDGPATSFKADSRRATSYPSWGLRRLRIARHSRLRGTPRNPAVCVARSAKVTANSVGFLTDEPTNLEAGSESATPPATTMSARSNPVNVFVIEPISKMSSAGSSPLPNASIPRVPSRSDPITTTGDRPASRRKVCARGVGFVIRSLHRLSDPDRSGAKRERLSFGTQRAETGSERRRARPTLRLEAAT